MFVLNKIAHRTSFYNRSGSKFTCTQKCFYNAMGSTAKWKTFIVMNSSVIGNNPYIFPTLCNNLKCFNANFRQLQCRGLWYSQSVTKIKYSRRFFNLFNKRFMSRTVMDKAVKKSSKFSSTELLRLYSLAKPEKWKLTGKNN